MTVTSSPAQLLKRFRKGSVRHVAPSVPGGPAVYAELTVDASTIVLVPTDDALYLLPTLKLATPAYKPSKPPGAITLPATWAAVVQLSAILGPAWRPGARLVTWVRARMAERASLTGQSLLVDPPDGCVPRRYQVDGALMIGAVGRVLLFDDPGTGKTITTILGLVERDLRLRELTGSVRPVVCVVPNSVIDSWVREWRTWCPDWHAVAWRGTPARRRALTGTADVYVTGYETARIDSAHPDSPLAKLRPRGLVVDECHMIKSARAGRSLAVRRLAKLAYGAYVALSGTPITHDPSDLWPTLEGLEPLAWPSSERYIARYCEKIQGDYGEKIIGLNRYTEPEFRITLMGQFRRVAKADVLPQLPPKVYSVRTVNLPSAWRAVYDSIEAQMYAELPDDAGELSVMSVLTQMGVLSRLASSAADVEYTTTVDDEGLEKRHLHLILKAPSWKVDALLEVLAERPGSPVVAFTPSRQLAMLAGAAAAEAGLSVAYVVGGQKPAERDQAVEEFQAGKHDVLCATTGAGGVGLTLTAARTLTFLQRPFSLVDALQAEDRGHRIGSEIHDAVEIIDIVAANTVESRVRELLRDKAGQLSDLLQDPRIARQVLGGNQHMKGGKKR